MKLKAITAILAMACGTLYAQSVEVKDAWVRTSVPGQKATGAFMKITAKDGAKLVAVSSPAAGVAEVHEMKMEGDVMKMRPVVNGLEIKPGQTVTFDPSGYHVMLVDLKEQLVQGERFKATLKFAKAGKIDVDFAIEGIGAKSGGGDMPGMGDMQMK